MHSPHFMCVNSSFAIIYMGKIELVASALLFVIWCLMIVMWLFLTMTQVCLQFAIVIYFLIILTYYFNNPGACLPGN